MLYHRPAVAPTINYRLHERLQQGDVMIQLASDYQKTPANTRTADGEFEGSSSGQKVASERARVEVSEYAVGKHAAKKEWQGDSGYAVVRPCRKVV